MSKIKVEPELIISEDSDDNSNATPSKNKACPIKKEKKKLFSTYKKTVLLKALKEHKCNPRQEKKIMSKLDRYKNIQYGTVKG